MEQLRSSSSAYLLKYYNVKEEGFFKNKVILDAVSYPNLEEYCYLNQKTMSMKSKLFFLSQIAHGLRFLRSYNIAHMDLKANNIVVIYKDFIIKLVDFGEAYHP